MKIDRTKNASRNVVFGVVLKIYQIVVPFILRTAMIYILGMEYVGLNSLFNSILQVLNLTELGVGSAMLFSMYKPIAEYDESTICKLMNLYKTYYRIIGLIILGFGLAITPVVPNLISNDTNLNINLYYLYWINLGYTVLSYWLFAYKGCLLQAHQRNDVISKVTLITNTIMYVLQISLLFFFKSYYLYLMGLLFGQVLTNITTALIASKMYPQYKAFGKLPKEQIAVINQKIKDLFTAKIGGVIQHSADSIVISAFLGLTILAKYNNYYYILNSVFGFIVIIFQSSMAGIGNSLITESLDKNYVDLKKITFLTEWITGFCSCCLLCLYQPFMKIWVGEDNLLSLGIVICFSIYLAIVVTNQMLCLYKDAAGVWHADRWRPLITALANLALNLLTVNFLGLFGIILSTIISMLFIGIPWLIKNLFSTVFKRSSIEYVSTLLFYTFVSSIACIICYWVCSLIEDIGIITFIIKMIICCIVPNTIFLIVYKRKNEFRDAIILVNSISKRRLENLPIFRKFLT